MSDRPKAILLDIEGTTSSLSFVTDTLFPYARKNLVAFVGAHIHDVQPILDRIPGDHFATLFQWMDEDRKETPLKALQGMIWAEGFAGGDLDGHVYPDTPEALRRWRAMGIAVHIYSSGSVQAQKLIFGHSTAGDLTPLLSGYFDTNIGPKREAGSYARIAGALGLAASDILFVTDTHAEADAARAAGMRALVIDREGGGGDVHSLAEVVQ